MPQKASALAQISKWPNKFIEEDYLCWGSKNLDDRDYRSYSRKFEKYLRVSRWSPTKNPENLRKKSACSAERDAKRSTAVQTC